MGVMDVAYWLGQFNPANIQSQNRIREAEAQQRIAEAAQERERQRQAANIRGLGPLFAERPGTPATTQDIPYSPDRADRAGFGAEVLGPPAPPGQFHPDRDERAGRVGPMVRSEAATRLAATRGFDPEAFFPSQAGPSPTSPALPDPQPRSEAALFADRSGQAAARAEITPATPPRRPSTMDVLFDPATPTPLLPDVLARGPGLDRMLQAPKVQEGVRLALEEMAANPEGDLFKVLAKHVGPHVRDVKELEDLMRPPLALARERSLEQQARFKAGEATQKTAEEARKAAEAERVRLQREAAARVKEEEIEDAIARKDFELARVLRLSPDPATPEAARQAAALYKLRTEEAGKTTRSTEQIEGRRKADEATHASRLELQRVGAQNARTLADHKTALAQGRATPDQSTKVGNMLLGWTRLLGQQLKREQALAQEAKDEGTDPTEHLDRIAALQDRIAKNEREMAGVHQQIKRARPGAPAPPARPGAAARDAYDRSRYFQAPAAPERTPPLDDDLSDEE